MLFFLKNMIKNVDLYITTNTHTPTHTHSEYTNEPNQIKGSDMQHLWVGGNRSQLCKKNIDIKPKYLTIS